MAAVAAASTEPVPPVRILIINPNTSTHMTEALKPAVEELGYPSVRRLSIWGPKLTKLTLLGRLFLLYVSQAWWHRQHQLSARRRPVGRDLSAVLGRAVATPRRVFGGLLQSASPCGFVEGGM